MNSGPGRIRKSKAQLRWLFKFGNKTIRKEQSSNLGWLFKFGLETIEVGQRKMKSTADLTQDHINRDGCFSARPETIEVGQHKMKSIADGRQPEIISIAAVEVNVR